MKPLKSWEKTDINVEIFLYRLPAIGVPSIASSLHSPLPLTENPVLHSHLLLLRLHN